MTRHLNVLMACMLLLMPACGPKEPPVEQYTDIKLKVVLFDTEAKLNDYIQSNFNVTEVNREGMAVWYLNDPEHECTLYLPRSITKESVYGHELMHCIYGSYHKE